MSVISVIRMYVKLQAASFGRYWLEQIVTTGFGWIPTVIGIGVRAVVYRCILRMDGAAGIDCGVRLRFASNIVLEQDVFLDQGTYLHACRNGIHIGRSSVVMHGAILHVYNFRDLPQAGIRIGESCLIGEYSVIRGQGGVTIGDRVYTSPHTQILAVNHVFDDPRKPFAEQGITAEGIVIEDDIAIDEGEITRVLL